MIDKVYLTSESVGRGHPDKICDEIADAILDCCLKHDPNSKVACEVFANNRLIVIGGNITTKCYVDVVQVAWSILKPLGYDENDFSIISNINNQSLDIAKQVNKSKNLLGAGDQGIVFGYATNETNQYLPISYVLANEILISIDKLIPTKLSYCKYDMKSQVSIFYQKKKIIIDSIVVAIQHAKKINLDLLRNDIKMYVIEPILKKYHLFSKHIKYFINKNGKFIIGGPIGDTGLTGRKIVVDTYGSIAHCGGGALSGKDSTKVDRSGAYFARYIAKNIVAAKLADKCEVQLSFCIGESKPLNMFINCFKTNKIALSKIYNAVNATFNFDLYNIIKELNLKKPIYYQTSVFGHFGKKNLPWEKVDKVKILRKYVYAR